MESRFAQNKPDPTIKKNVIEARQGVKRTKRAQSFVIAASMAITVLAGVFFSQRDAQLQAAMQLADTAAPSASVQQTASTSPTPLVASIEVSSVSQTTP